MYKRILPVVLSLMVFVVMAACLFGQASGTDQDISGTVTDTSGGVVPNATVTITNTDTNLVRTVTTNATGRWVATNLPIGNYKVSTAANGFKTAVVTGLVLQTAAHLTSNSVLEVGQATESVQVEAAPIQVETASGEVAHTVTGTEASEIQLNGRNYLQLLSLAPGVSTIYASGFTGLLGNFGNSANQQSVNGAPPGSFSASLNGVDNKDPGGNNGTNINIAPDMLAEYRTVASNFSAEYGMTAGATYVVSLKSGTKQFHGGAYEFLRNNDIQAYAYQPIGTTVPVKPPLVYNNWGWNLGGPVFLPGKFNSDRDKLFFFVGEDYKDRRTSTITNWVVPSLAQRAGNFSALPSSQWPLIPGTSTPFAGGVIPASLIDPGMARVLALYPQPNASNGSFNFLSENPLNVNEIVVRADWLATPRNTMSAHFTQDTTHNLGNPTNTITFNRNIPYLNGGITWTAIISPTMVNTLLPFVSGGDIYENTGIGPNPQLGITSLNKGTLGITNMPSLYNQTDDVPSVTITNFTALTTTPIAFNSFTRTYGIRDDLSKVIGNHTLKFGYQYERDHKWQNLPGALNGTYGFTTAGHVGTSGNALADAVLGNFASYTETSTDPFTVSRATRMDFYAQDDWKASRRLTINLGIRFEYWPPSYTALSNATYFLPQYFNASQAATVSPTTGFITSLPNPYNGLVLQGSSFPSAATGQFPASVLTNPQVLALFHGLPKGVQNDDWGLFQPRVGFAYDLTGKQKTVLRGGFGVQNDQPSTIVQNTNNPPFLTTAAITNGTVDNPGGGSSNISPYTITGSHPLSLKYARYFNWSMGIQQQVGANGRLELIYAGSSGYDMPVGLNINALHGGVLAAHPGVNAASLFPYQGYASLVETTNAGDYHYNSLQSQFRKQIAGSGIFTASFTWSKNLTDNVAVPENPYNLRADYGPTSYNRTKVLNFSYVYPLPFWRNGSAWYKQALGNWQLSGVTSIQSGLPINVVIPTDTAGTITGTTVANTQRPNLTGAAIYGEGTQYLNPAAFVTPATGTFGILGYDRIVGPRMNNWDASLMKLFTVKERVTFEFRAEMFNFPNHLSYFGVNATTGAATFGQVSSATDPRTMEFALKMKF